MKAPAVHFAIKHKVKRQIPGWKRRFALVLSVTAVLAGCHSGGRLPDRSSKTYSDFVSVFYVGLAALQVGDDVRAETSLAEATKLVAAEPAGWANWGILALRQRTF